MRPSSTNMPISTMSITDTHTGRRTRLASPIRTRIGTSPWFTCIRTTPTFTIAIGTESHERTYPIFQLRVYGPHLPLDAFLLGKRDVIAHGRLFDLIRPLNHSVVRLAYALRPGKR